VQCFLICFLATAVSIWPAQLPAGPAVQEAEAAPLVLSAHHATVAVADVERESAWYLRVLGFKEVKRSMRGTMLVVRLANPTYRIDLVWEKGSTRPPKQPRAFQQGWMNIVLQTPSLQAALDHLTAEGVSVKIDRDSGNALEHLTFEDAEGNEIGLAPESPDGR
jgi:catechol 2,3-dioxygenase-like lactoylglutathione lyase family enzyme